MQRNNQTNFKKTEIGPIPEEWEISDVGYFCSNIASGGTPFRGNKDYYKNGSICWVKTGELNDFYIYDTEEKITENAIKNSAAKIFPKNTVSMAMYGATVGKLGILGREASTNQACCNMVANVDSDFKFLFYSLLNKRDELVGRANGAAQQNLSVGTIKSFKLAKPSKNEQKQIAEVLSSFDDKIELNRKINANLEKIAGALFKRWFVDFEFSDKNGKPYKSSGGKIIESELGGIPEGWNISTIGKELETFLGGTPSRINDKYWVNGNIPWINSGKVNEYRIIKASEYITKEALDNSAAKLLPKGTVVIAITGATLGQYSLLEIDSSFNQSVIGIQESENFKKEFIYFWIKNNIKEIIKAQTGGAQQHINKQVVDKYKILVPDQKILNSYYKIAISIFSMISINCFEIENLSNLRDSLLPRLMNGKIRVKI